MTSVIVWAEVALAETSDRIAAAIEKAFVDRDRRRLVCSAVREGMNNAGAGAERERRLPEPALQSAVRVIFHHTGSERLWSKRKIITDAACAADEFDLAPECAQGQVQGVIDDEPPGRHERALT